MYRGITSDEKPIDFTNVICTVGEKGNYFRKQLLDITNPEYEIYNINENEIDDLALSSHTRSTKNSMYVSTTQSLEVAKQYIKDSLEYKYISYIYIDTEKDINTYKKLTPSITDYMEDKETTFLHAIFADRITGVYCMDDDNFYINPNLYKELTKGVPDHFVTDQSEFNKYKNRLGYKHETWR